MHVLARAPGKLVVLGEYVVLAGGPALVMAVDHHCVAELRPSDEDVCHLSTLADCSEDRSFGSAEASDVAIVDSVMRHWPSDDVGAWRGRLDSSRLFVAGRKLGLGSSAAALVAWAGAWTGYTRSEAGSAAYPSLAELVDLHRTIQAGAGSGLDVAASLHGGVLAYRLVSVDRPEAVSVALPNSVRFIGVSTPRAASTPDLLARFEAWRVTEPAAAAMQLDRMRQVAELGVASASAGDAAQFLAAVQRYGLELDALGTAIGVDIVTPEHAAIADVAARVGVTYKVSGAGGGDLGLGFATDDEALEAFAAAVPVGCEVLRLAIDRAGLVTEERAA